jgi:Zn-dependent M28 family amino/carboxypeptidase
VVLADEGRMWEDEKTAFPRWIGFTQAMKDAGVLGVLWTGTVPSNVLTSWPAIFGGTIYPVPQAVVGREDALTLGRLLRAGPVKVSFELTNRVGGPREVANVVGTLRGSGATDEWVLVGAHLDTVDASAGAQDDASGVAMVIEAARAIVASGKPPRRSIRFVLFASEEEYLLGSRAYVKAHEKELPGCVAMLNTDNGAGRPRGWKVEGRDDVRQALQPLAKELLEDLGAAEVSMKASFDTDQGAFALAGVPALDLWVDMSHYGEIHHRPSDTFDKVEPLDLKAGAAVVAVTAFALADASAPLAAHLDRAGVEKLFKETGLEPVVRAVGAWP